MSAIRLTLSALVAAFALTSQPAIAQTEAERQAIVEQGRAEHNQRVSGLRAEIAAAVAKFQEIEDCSQEAGKIEALALTGKGRLVGPAIETLLTPLCDPGETSEWVFVQQAHFSFHHQISTGGAGGASGTALSVRFPSLVSCFRAGQEVRKHLSRPYEVRSACVDARTGTLIRIE